MLENSEQGLSRFRQDPDLRTVIIQRALRPPHEAATGAIHPCIVETFTFLVDFAYMRVISVYQLPELLMARQNRRDIFDPNAG